MADKTTAQHLYGHETDHLQSVDSVDENGNVIFHPEFEKYNQLNIETSGKDGYGYTSAGDAQLWERGLISDEEYDKRKEEHREYLSNPAEFRERLNAMKKHMVKNNFNYMNASADEIEDYLYNMPELSDNPNEATMTKDDIIRFNQQGSVLGRSGTLSNEVDEFMTYNRTEPVNLDQSRDKVGLNEWFNIDEKERDHLIKLYENGKTNRLNQKLKKIGINKDSEDYYIKNLLESGAKTKEERILQLEGYDASSLTNDRINHFGDNYVEGDYIQSATNHLNSRYPDGIPEKEQKHLDWMKAYREKRNKQIIDGYNKNLDEKGNPTWKIDSETVDPGNGRIPAVNKKWLEKVFKEYASEDQMPNEGELPTAQTGLDMSNALKFYQSEQDNEGRKFLMDMTNSPLFKDRARKMLPTANYFNGKYEDDIYLDKVKADIQNNIQTLNFIPSDNPSPAYPGAKGVYREGESQADKDKTNFLDYMANESFLGKLTPKRSAIANQIVNSNRVIEQNPHSVLYNPGAKTVRLHEGSHGSTRGQNPEYFEGMLGKILPDSKMIMDAGLQDMFSYLSIPTEQKARVDVMRKMMLDNELYDPINEVFEEKHYNNLQKYLDKNRKSLKTNSPDLDDHINQSYDIYSKDNFIELMNSFVQNETENEGQLPKAQEGKEPSIEDQVYSRFPALRNMGEVTFKADPEFTREVTGIGDIEYFGPGEDKTQITYPNSFVYPHPKVGTHGIVYNPETNNAQSIALDMLHGLGKDDKNYEKLRNKFGESYMNSIFREDFERDVKMFKEEIGEDKFNEWYDDDKDYFNQSYVDGIIRNLLFEGSPEDFKESRYWEGAREGYLSQQGLKETFNALEGYLKTPTKKHGGQLPTAQKGNEIGDVVDKATMERLKAQGYTFEEI